MKVYELFERQDDTALKKADEQIDTLEAAYDEIALLRQVFKKKDFGVLIGKKGRMLSLGEIREIKRKLSNIIRNNPLIDGQEVSRGRDGEEKMKLLVKSLHHRTELAVTSILTVLLSAAAITSGPIGASLWGAGAVVSGALAKKQYSTVKSVKSLSRLMNLVDSYGELTPNSVKRSGVKKFMDFIMRKTPKEIEKDMERKLRKETNKAKRKMEKDLRGFPMFINYKDGNEVKEYPVVNLFNI